MNHFEVWQQHERSLEAESHHAEQASELIARLLAACAQASEIIARLLSECGPEWAEQVYEQITVPSFMKIED